MGYIREKKRAKSRRTYKTTAESRVFTNPVLSLSWPWSIMLLMLSWKIVSCCHITPWKKSLEYNALKLFFGILWFNPQKFSDQLPQLLNQQNILKSSTSKQVSGALKTIVEGDVYAKEKNKTNTKKKCRITFVQQRFCPWPGFYQDYYQYWDLEVWPNSWFSSVGLLSNVILLYVAMVIWQLSGRSWSFAVFW